MTIDVLAKSDRDSRHATLRAVLSDDFEDAARTLQYPLTPEVKFSSVASLVRELTTLMKKEFQSEDGIGTLSVHGHAQWNGSGARLEFGNDYVSTDSFETYAVDFKKIGALMGDGGEVHLLHCFIGSDPYLGTKMAKCMGVPVTGEMGLNNLGPAFTPFQRTLKVLGGGHDSGPGGVRVGTKTFHPDGTVATDKRNDYVRF